MPVILLSALFLVGDFVAMEVFSIFLDDVLNILRIESHNDTKTSSRGNTESTAH
jgi:hypothetical protein